MFFMRCSRLRFQCLQPFLCYALLLTVLLTIILIARNQSADDSLSGHRGKVLHVEDSNFNFYETFKEDEEETTTRTQGEQPSEQLASSNEELATIHLASICAGQNATREFYILLKSILFYRTNPLHLHLMVDEIARKILDELFGTWQVPDLEVSFYNASQYESQISWLPTHHYSSQYGLLKLVLPAVVWQRNIDGLIRVNKLIMLDTDMLMLGNVRDLFKYFHLMAKNGSSIGLVENQSDWYLGGGAARGQSYAVGAAPDSGRLVWPALGRGFNTGLMLLDLEHLTNTEGKEENWEEIWRETAELELVTRYSTALADQDIINAALKLRPHLCYKLPCACNIQLNDRAAWLEETCGPRWALEGQFRLIHWNSPHKLNTNSLFAADFLSWYTTFVNWDASLLRRQVRAQASDLFRAPSLSETAGEEAGKAVELGTWMWCSEMRPRPDERLRTLLYSVVEQSAPNDWPGSKTDKDKDRDKDVTLVVHLSADRVRALDELALHWRGPISAAVYLAEPETSLFLESMRDSRQLGHRRNIGIHLVFRDHGFNYPINRLRNIALDQAQTGYVFLIDVDFLPSLNLYDYLLNFIGSYEAAPLNLADQVHHNHQQADKRALVVPAFESSQYKFDFPSSKSDLVRQLNLGTVSAFREQLWPRGHAPTDFKRWRLASRAYKVDWRPDFEPFLVVRRATVARFDERFVGFGWNKVEHVMQLAADDYEFWVLPDAFVVHQFHPASYDIVRHRESQTYRACIKHLKRLFTSELVAKRPKFLDKLKREGFVAAPAALYAANQSRAGESVPPNQE